MTCVKYWYVLFHSVCRGVADIFGREKFSIHLLKRRPMKRSVVVGGSDIVLGDMKRLRGLETVNAGLDVWAVGYCFIELSELIVWAVDWLEWNNL
jgi:hypothetical protein